LLCTRRGRCPTCPAEQSSAKVPAEAQSNNEGTKKKKQVPPLPIYSHSESIGSVRMTAAKITLSSRAEHNDSLANRYAQSRDLLFGVPLPHPLLWPTGAVESSPQNSIACACSEPFLHRP